MQLFLLSDAKFGWGGDEVEVVVFLLTFFSCLCACMFYEYDFVSLGCGICCGCFIMWK